MKLTIKDQIKLAYKRVFSKDVRIRLTYKRKSDETVADYVVDGKFISNTVDHIVTYGYAGKTNGSVKTFIKNRIEKAVVL